MDRSIFALFLMRTHRSARARGLGGMIKKIVTSPCNGLDLFISLIGILLTILALFLMPTECVV